MLRSFESGGGEGEDNCVEKMLQMKITKYINNIYGYLLYMIYYYELNLGHADFLKSLTISILLSFLREKHIIFTHSSGKIWYFNF